MRMKRRIRQLAPAKISLSIAFLFSIESEGNFENSYMDVLWRRFEVQEIFYAQQKDVRNFS